MEAVQIFRCEAWQTSIHLPAWLTGRILSDRGLIKRRNEHASHWMTERIALASVAISIIHRFQIPIKIIYMIDSVRNTQVLREHSKCLITLFTLLPLVVQSQP